MPTIVLHFYLLLLPVFVAVALPIAVAGERKGSRGARNTAFTIWIVLTLVQPIFWPHGLDFPLLFWLLSPIVAGITLAIIFIPMNSLSRCSWTRGRMAAGLVASAVMPLIYPFLVAVALDLTFP